MGLFRNVILALSALLAATGAHAQIAFRASSQAAVAAATTPTHVGVGNVASTNNNSCPSITPTVPAGSVGDLLIAVVSSGDNVAINMAGWNTLLANAPVGNYQAKLFWRVAQATNASTITRGATSGCNVIIARISRFTGTHPTEPIQGIFAPATLPGGTQPACALPGGGNWCYQNAGTVTTGEQTTIDDNALLVMTAHTADNSNITGGLPPEFTFQWENVTTSGNDASIALFTVTQPAAGTFGPYTLNKNRGADPNHGVLFALRSQGLRINVPAGTVADDVMVAGIASRPCSGSSGGACTTSITPPAGWTLVNALDQTTGGGTGGFGNNLNIYIRVATGAEPAAYTWRFAGTPVNNGAVGGILSFSGVDTTAPIVAEAGQVTPNAATHTAPSIDTLLETNTMLVGSFAANSSATWTPPAGMTERVDIPSLPVPDDLGLSIEMAHELRVAAGATGTRTATQATPPGNDTGAAHLLALRPRVTVHHYAISVVSTTVANCDFAQVTITAHNAGHTAVNPPLGRIVTLSVSANPGTAAWQSPAVSGTGVWTPGALGTATYAWPGTESSFTVRLRQSVAGSLSVNANDTFVSEDPTEDPPISFVSSAFRISNGANALLSVNNQIAAKPSNTGVGTQALFLQAVETSPTGSCTSVFPNGAEIDIQVGAECSSPAACTQNVSLTTQATGGSPTGSFVPAGAGTYPATIRFRFTTANAEAPFFFNYADAGQIRLQFRHITAAPAVTITGTSNLFVTRPFGFAFRGADAATAIQHGTLPTSALLAAAGDNFIMTLAAYRWVGAEDDGTGNPLAGANLTDNGLTPNFSAITTVSPTGNLPGVATGVVSRGPACASAATIAAGSWSGGAATIGDWCYNEAGNVFLAASSTSYFGIAGFNISGNSGLDGTGAANGYVGRFKPKHFVVTGVPTLTNRVALACAPASTFTYMNEGLRLGFTLQARNAQNLLTQNYTGAYAKLDLTAAANLGIGARSGGGTILTPRVDNALPPAGSFTNGAAALTVTTAIRRATPDNPDGPYPGTQFGIAPNDNDPNAVTGVQMQAFNLDADAGIPGDDHFAIAPTTELRFGRLQLQNAYGSVGQALPIPISIQHWNGSAFVTNTLDSCTTLARANIALAFAGTISACNTFVQQASLAFSTGVATLTLSAPGTGNSGTVLLTPQLGTAVGTYCPASPGGTAAATASPAVYLLGRWDDAANPDGDANTSYDDKPSGQAGFGLYGSQPRNFIFFRENY